MERQLDFFFKKDLKVGDNGSKYLLKSEKKARKADLGNRLILAKVNSQTIELRSGDSKTLTPYTITLANVQRLRSLPAERIASFVHIPLGDSGAQLVTLRAKTDADFQDIIKALGSSPNSTTGNQQTNGKKYNSSKGKKGGERQSSRDYGHRSSREQHKSRRPSSYDATSTTSSSLTAVFTVDNERGQQTYQILRSPTMLRKQLKSQKQGGKQGKSQRYRSSSSSSSSLSSTMEKSKKHKSGKSKKGKSRRHRSSSSSSSSSFATVATRASSHLTYYSDTLTSTSSSSAHGHRHKQSNKRNKSHENKVCFISTDGVTTAQPATLMNPHVHKMSPNRMPSCRMSPLPHGRLESGRTSPSNFTNCKLLKCSPCRQPVMQSLETPCCRPECRESCVERRRLVSEDGKVFTAAKSCPMECSIAKPLCCPNGGKKCSCEIGRVVRQDRSPNRICFSAPRRGCSPDCSSSSGGSNDIYVKSPHRMVRRAPTLVARPCSEQRICCFECQKEITNCSESRPCCDAQMAQMKFAVRPMC